MSREEMIEYIKENGIVSDFKSVVLTNPDEAQDALLQRTSDTQLWLLISNWDKQHTIKEPIPPYGPLSYYK